MVNDTFQTILNLSDERFQLYLLAGHQRLTPGEQARIDELTGRLYVLWDQHRRELAAGSRETVERLAAQARYKTPVAIDTHVEEDRRAA